MMKQQKDSANTSFFRFYFSTFVAAAAALCIGLPAAATDADTEATPLFAQVGPTTIDLGDFQMELRHAVRSRYYHGQPPANEIADFYRKVADNLVARTLLAQEAARRNIKPDAEKIGKELTAIERRFGKNPNWAKERTRMLPALEKRLAQHDIVRQLEQSVRDVPAPGDEATRDFYRQNPDLFTEPERSRLSVILLRVDPSAPAASWQGARDEAAGLFTRLQAGADFAELARLHSGDASAAQGGDMGYVHQGMLTKPAQEAVDELEVGQLSEPIRVLEGVALFRLDERTAKQLRAFDTVRERAAALWRRQQGNAEWTDLIAQLRKTTPIRIEEKYLSPPPQETQLGTATEQTEVAG